ncbi:putative vacuolar-type Ca2 -ATPase [Leptomonas seymouri]|uniref:Putative vacuolar-type Ca2-ATPase n=1 Tax=Leptomonas seymouri TaxID=5684 RepID=A0A0N1P9U3_LEPSE|nr:putative vacuolar-type Ca2 -ATPase [Leptomonas seymouri]|eukprot:KPI83483.1 putative vacuolar-type Ca2 -ATPase [Leptomonas seymouri]
MHVTISAVALYILVVSLALQAYGNVWFGAGDMGGVEHRTIIFNVFVLCTLFHMFSCRKLYDELNAFEGLWSRSRPFMAVVAFCFGFQFLAVETFGDFMNVTALRGDEWFACFMVSVVVLIVCFIVRLVPVKEPVFEKSFDPALLDEDAKKMLSKLDSAVATAQESNPAFGKGEYLSKACRLRARALWREARQHHVTAGRVVNAFRRARAEKLGEPNGLSALA